MNAILLNSHVLGAGFSLAVVVFAAIFLIHRPLSKERLDIIRTLIKVGAGGIVWLIITGAGLFTERPQDSSSTVLFWVKVGLLIVDVVLISVLLNRKVKSLETTESGKVVKLATLLAWTVFNIIVIIIVSIFSLNISN